MVLNQQGAPVVVSPPGRWIPSESKQTGPKNEFDVFIGRQEYLMVSFRKNTTPVNATSERVSDQHDVALIKVSAVSALPKVDLRDTYTESKVGAQVIVMGYPGVSNVVYAVVRSRDMFNRDAQQRVVPDPTVSVGNIGKIIRAADGPVTQSEMHFAPSGDTYQLTINSTGGGNSGARCSTRTDVSSGSTSPASGPTPRSRSRSDPVWPRADDDVPQLELTRQHPCTPAPGFAQRSDRIDWSSSWGPAAWVRCTAPWIHAGRGGGGEGPDLGPGVPALVERFRNEARIHATLNHPHIARMHEFIDPPAAPCIVMEYIDGQTLDQLIQKRGALPMKEALMLATAVIDAVGHMHERGIIHRDIKSTNVKMSDAGVIKLLDFGIAKGPGSPALTADGSVIGTLQSLAPEQLEGRPADRRSDIWSLGIMLYELVTGGHPFTGDGADGITARIRAGRFTAPSRVITGLSPAIDRIVARCLRVSPKERYGSCEALLTDVRALVEPAPVVAMPARGVISNEMLVQARSHAPLLVAVSAAVVAIGFLGWSVSRPDTPQLVPGGQVMDPPAAVDPVPVVGTVVQDTTMRAVTIHVMAGEAEVWRNGELIGRTPYRVQGAIGDEVSIVLRRTGYADEPVKFNMVEGRGEYSVVMRRIGQRPTSSLPPLVPLLGFAWFSLPWRRRATAPPAQPTIERPSCAGGTRGVTRDRGDGNRSGCVRDENEIRERGAPPDRLIAERACWTLWRGVGVAAVKRRADRGRRDRSDYVAWQRRSGLALAER